MSTEPTTTEAPAAAWGDPQPPAPKWSGRKTAIAAAVAVVIAAVGGVAIYLGTSSEANQQSGMGGMGGGRMGGMGQMNGTASIMREALHGDFTVSADGGYAVERFQTGEVTASSDTSVTVKSTDGYTQTYAIDSSTEKSGDLTTGKSVTVLAKVSGDTATATSVTDSSQMSQQGGPGGQQGGFPGGGQGGFPGGQQGGVPGRSQN